MAKLQVVVGGQAGSEGKGAVSGALARRGGDRLLAIRTGGPNAGHCVWSREHNQLIKLRCVPTAAVTNPNARLALAAGSEVDEEVLGEELLMLDRLGYEASGRMVVDRSATKLTDQHRVVEHAVGLNARLGSTGKGVGAARAERIMRTADIYGGSVDVGGMCRSWLHSNGNVLIEAAQGYALGLHGPFYPFATSGDCRAIDALAAVGYSPWSVSGVELEVWVVLRTFPIRVAGNSGPLLGETTWEALGLEEEITTVTLKVRRVGAWDPELAREAVAANGGPGGCVKIAMTGVDYVFGRLEKQRGEERLDTQAGDLELMDWLREKEIELGQQVECVGIGPDSQMWR